MTSVPPREPASPAAIKARRRASRPSRWFTLVPGPEKNAQAQLANGQGRFRFASLSMLFLLLCLVVRAGWVMLLPDAALEEATRSQYEVAEEHRGTRGDIIDRNGRVLATTVKLSSLYVNPRAIQEAPGQEQIWIPRLAALVGKDVAFVESKFAVPKHRDKRAAEVRLGDGLDPDAVKVFMAEYGAAFRSYDKSQRLAKATRPAHPWIWSSTDETRVYPGRNLAGPLLGFTDSLDGGASGLEYRLDKELAGETYRVLVQQDRKGNNVSGGADEARLARNGNTVRLTLDAAIQHAAEEALERTAYKFEPEAAMAVVMDVRTGAVLALANWPAGNPNDASDRVDDQTNFSRKFTNRALMDQHEPGSVMKPFVMAAALQEKVTTPDELIDCMNGYWPALRIHDANHRYGILSVTDVLAHSSNIGTAQIGLRLGANRLHRYITAFGFGRVSGMGLGGELPGALTSLTNNLTTPKPRPQEVANASFGQGVTASTIQLTAALSAIANGGKRMYPYLVDAVVENDVPTPRAPREDRQVISEEVARQVTDMMEAVVTDGTGKSAAVAGYRVAGKTGTAQMTEVDPVTKKSRYGNNYLGSFIGFLPADRPEVAIAVSVVAPQLGTKYGGDVAGPVFSEIGGFTMRYLGIQPDPPTVLVVDPADPTKKIAVAAPAKPVPAPVVVEPIVVSARGGQWRMPDLANRTLRDSVKAIESTGAAVDVRGFGRLVSQSPAVGAPIGPGVTVQLQFQ